MTGRGKARPAPPTTPPSRHQLSLGLVHPPHSPGPGVRPHHGREPGAPTLRPSRAPAVPGGLPTSLSPTTPFSPRGPLHAFEKVASPPPPVHLLASADVTSASQLAIPASLPGQNPHMNAPLARQQWSQAWAQGRANLPSNPPARSLTIGRRAQPLHAAAVRVRKLLEATHHVWPLLLAFTGSPLTPPAWFLRAPTTPGHRCSRLSRLSRLPGSAAPGHSVAHSPLGQVSLHMDTAHSQARAHACTTAPRSLRGAPRAPAPPSGRGT